MIAQHAAIKQDKSMLSMLGAPQLQLSGGYKSPGMKAEPNSPKLSSEQKHKMAVLALANFLSSQPWKKPSHSHTWKSSGLSSLSSHHHRWA